MLKSRQIHFRYYPYILTLTAALLLISNLAATKVVAFGPIIADGGAVMFPITYILGDVLAEVYGFKYARQAIWTSFGIMVLAVILFTIVRFLPVSDYSNQDAFVAVLGFFPRIVVASLAAFLIGSFVNATIVAWLKVKMQGRRMWVRLLGSTLVGEFFDTTVFGLVAFAGIFTAPDMVKYILIGWLFKTAVEAVMLFPVTYPVIRALKKREHFDAYDKDLEFNPFSLSTEK